MAHDLYFHHVFRYSKKSWPDIARFTLSLQTKLPGVTAWLNGQPLSDLRKGRTDWTCKLEASKLRGVNVLAIAVSSEAPPSSSGSPEKAKGGRQAKKAGQAKPPAIRPEAGLVPRPGDEELDTEILSQLKWFNGVKKLPPPDRNPGTFVLRRFEKMDPPDEDDGSAGDETEDRSVMCIEGERGHSAFYILTAEEMFLVRKHLRFRELGADAPEDFLDFSPDQILDWLKESPPDTGSQTDLLREAAEQALAMEGKSSTHQDRRCAIASICGGNGNPGGAEGDTRRHSIRNDGVCDLDAETQTADMYEGELFGEMACMNHTARSATVVATRTIYVVEFLRNGLEAIREDPRFADLILETYKERVFELHLNDTTLFRDLSEPDLKRLKESLILKRFKAGTVIFEEGDEADCAYLIRLGLVQVVKGIKSFELSVKQTHVLDWTGLCHRLAKFDRKIFTECPNCRTDLFLNDETDWGKKARCYQCQHVFVLERPGQFETVQAVGEETDLNQEASPDPTPEEKLEWDCLMALWERLEPRIQHRVRKAKLRNAPPSEEDQLAILKSLNQIVSKPGFLADKKDKRVSNYLNQFKEQIHATLDRVNQWTRLGDYIRGRLLLYYLFPDAITKPHFADQSLRILAYRGRGDIIGEMGVVTRTLEDGSVINDQYHKRNATCIAYNHLDPENSPLDLSKRSEVELIGIPKETFNALLKSNPALQTKIDAIVKTRNAELRADEGDDSTNWSNPVTLTAEFHDQGLVQGKKLMLIDLESCTRCGDCVRGCIESHTDGHSRLFLDGPTFGKYLVPSTCRNCWDPVCMIGCPVDAIHKGHNDQIVINNNCVGCEICAEQCPYDSIQMHDTGLIPANTEGWRVAPADAIRGGQWRWWWWWPKSLGRVWTDCPTPCEWDFEFRERLRLSGGQAASTVIERLSNMLEYGDKILSARLDPDQNITMSSHDSRIEVTINRKPFIATVCDQCSDVPGLDPACVAECPHEAAFRINGRTEFPAQ